MYLILGLFILGLLSLWLSDNKENKQQEKLRNAKRFKGNNKKG